MLGSLEFFGHITDRSVSCLLKGYNEIYPIILRLWKVIGNQIKIDFRLLKLFIHINILEFMKMFHISDTIP